MPEGPRKALVEWYERQKAQARTRVEHPFHVIKNLSAIARSATEPLLNFAFAT